MPKLTFLGHSAFLIESDKGSLVIDPFLSSNPKAAAKAENIKVSHVLLTHGHGDHLGDGLKIAKANNATIIAPNELAIYCQKKGYNAHPMHIGGAFNFPFGRVKLSIAHHGSGTDLGGDALTYMGNPCGFVITIDGVTIYHAGDTGLFMDMQLIGKLDKLDVALLPIGDNFTMGIDDAAIAAEFLNPGLVVPMHYNTFDVIKVDPVRFKEKVEAKNINVLIMEPGDSTTLT